MPVNFTRETRCLFSVAVCVAAVTQTATADVGFLLPNTFHTDETGKVTTIASFSDRFPSVEHALRSDDYHIVAPNGERMQFETVQNLEQMTVLFAVLKRPGAYRLSSGERLGRKGEVSIREGAYIRLGEDGIDKATLPDGAAILTSQTATVSEAYVLHGETDRPTTLETSGRLSIHLSVGENGFRETAPVRASVSFDGAALAGAEITLLSASCKYTDRPEGFVSVLDAEGEVEISSDMAGPHVVLVRHISKAPAGAETDVRSYSTALVFENYPNDSRQ